MFVTIFQGKWISMDPESEVLPLAAHHHTSHTDMGHVGIPIQTWDTWTSTQTWDTWTT